MPQFDRLLIRLTDAVFRSVDRLAALLTGRRVSDITTDEVRQLQDSVRVASDAESDAESACEFVIVDVRSAKEWAVSMLPGAITKDEYEENQTQYRERLIIPYCTVGGRSHLYTRKLVKAGLNTRNYRSGIVGWCQAHIPLVTYDGQSTVRVHVGHSVYSVPEEYDPVS